MVSPPLPMRHCKADSYKHDSQKQRHDGTCGFSTAGGPQFDTCSRVSSFRKYNIYNVCVIFRPKMIF
ncbi:unnamed protein product [Staurois parvus]|uniref:Uncharacterized protein n=1 Tax=Staurois parvus TaxID=386267 RepID=A0ABN9FZM9_9NEOB|nr:unnamed protein product [Staurois parvus]